MPKTPRFIVGDRVAYSVQWLKSVGMAHTDCAHARGEITELTPFGGTELAAITWDRDGIPARVSTANLAKVGPNSRFASC